MCTHNDDNDYSVIIDSDYYNNDYDDIEEQKEQEVESGIKFE